MAKTVLPGGRTSTRQRRADARPASRHAHPVTQWRGAVSARRWGVDEIRHDARRPTGRPVGRSTMCCHVPFPITRRTRTRTYAHAISCYLSHADARADARASSRTGRLSPTPSTHREPRPPRKTDMVKPHNGMPAGEVTDVTWRKSRRSNPSGNCVELATLPDGQGIALRNSRDPQGPALLFTPSRNRGFRPGCPGWRFRRSSDVMPLCGVTKCTGASTHNHGVEASPLYGFTLGSWHAYAKVHDVLVSRHREIASADPPEPARTLVGTAAPADGLRQKRIRRSGT